MRFDTLRILKAHGRNNANGFLKVETLFPRTDFPNSGPNIQGTSQYFLKVNEMNFPTVDTRFPKVEKSFSKIKFESF